MRTEEEDLYGYDDKEVRDGEAPHITIHLDEGGRTTIRNVSADQWVVFGTGFDGERFFLKPGETLGTVATTLVFHLVKKPR